MRGGRGVQRPRVMHAVAPTTVPKTLTAVETVATNLVRAQNKHIFPGFLEEAIVSANSNRKVNTTISESSKIVRLTPKTLSVSATEHASILFGKGSTTVLVTSVAESTSLLRDVGNRFRELATDRVTAEASVNYMKSLGFTLASTAHVMPGLTKQTPKLLGAIPVVETVVNLGKPHRIGLQSSITTVSGSVRGVTNKSFLIVVGIFAVTNRGYKGPPKVLQLYDLSDRYKPPRIFDGATVSYMNGILGVGVAFDIYEAYEIAGGPFWVCDNGIKEVLDKHPVVVRLQ